MKKIYSTLLIDDSAGDRKWCHIIMKKTGCFEHIYDASTGQEALDFFSNQSKSKDDYADAFPPVLIFLDINMPAMNGFEFLDRFRSIREGIIGDGNTPLVVLMVTSSNNPADRAKAKEYGFVSEFITKPITKESALEIANKYGVNF